VGDAVTLLTPAGNISFNVGQLYNTKNNEAIEAALGSRYRVDVVVPEISQLEISQDDLEKGLLVKDL